MKDEIIKYETAVLAKKKGFDIFSNTYYDNEDFLRDGNDYGNSYPDVFAYAPTQSLLQRFLRENHGIHVLVYMDEILWDTFRFRILMDQKEVYNERLKIYDTYESALEAALLEGLKLIK